MFVKIVKCRSCGKEIKNVNKEMIIDGLSYECNKCFKKGVLLAPFDMLNKAIKLKGAYVTIDGKVVVEE